MNMRTLYLESCGAVTPVGLDGFSTCAAIRAGINRVSYAIPVPPPGEPLKAARVKAGRALRRTPREWLLNLASRALNECVVSMQPSTRPVALFVCPPEPFRKHPGLEGIARQDFVSMLAARHGLKLHPGSRVLDGGAASVFDALAVARELLAQDAIARAFIGGVDSLLNDRDIERLRRGHRLYEEGNPQGLIPGEAAAFLCVTRSGSESPYVPIAALRGSGTAHEHQTVDGPRYSVGEGLGKAVRLAIDDARISEAEVSFVVSNHNGERYAAWETTFSHARTYRTRRERLPVMYPAASIGDVGTAAAALSVIIAGVAVAREYAPGKTALCECRSEESLRGACVVGPSPVSSPFSAPGQRRLARHA
ncbi:hypothetical protein [Corallococcus sp. CA047B]|uniref:hypothetical protein n=1 Tax=Corallococcus sp. CA047B TaxID=2316729 RepID=UPI0011C3C694|nr:hypothetical protein [Corallococcus sp. CA047B]